MISVFIFATFSLIANIALVYGTLSMIESIRNDIDEIEHDIEEVKKKQKQKSTYSR